MKTLTDLSQMPFGKFKGKPMQDVPASYLHYLWTNGKRNEVSTNDVADYISKNLHALRTENKDLIWD